MPRDGTVEPKSPSRKREAEKRQWRFTVAGGAPENRLGKGLFPDWAARTTDFNRDSRCLLKPKSPELRI